MKMSLEHTQGVKSMKHNTNKTNRRIISGAIAIAISTSVWASADTASKSSFMEALTAIKEIQQKQDGKKLNAGAIQAPGGMLPLPPLMNGAPGMLQLPAESAISSGVKSSKLLDDDVVANARNGVDREKSLPRAIGFTSVGDEQYAYVAFDGKVFKLKTGSIFGNFRLDKIEFDRMTVSMLVNGKKAKTFTSYADITVPKVETASVAVPGQALTQAR